MAMSTEESMAAAFQTGDESEHACGRRIRIARLSLPGRVTIQEFAEMIGTKGNNLQSAERGRQFPRPSHVRRVWEITGADFNFVHLGRFNHLPLEIATRLYVTAKTVPIES